MDEARRADGQIPVGTQQTQTLVHPTRAYRSPRHELHYRSVVNVAADLAQFVHQRELLAYQSRLARSAYAYGVDLRRTAWLESSTVGEPLMRAVDRRWTTLVQSLRTDVLRPDGEAAPSVLLEELMRIIRLLRAPRPTVRLLRANVDERQWPAASPLGTTKGGAHWLLLDPERLLALPQTERTFVLASALGNLQCDHGPLFAAHLIAYRGGRGLSLLRQVLTPWAKVGSFSSDRAALLAIGELEPTLEALHLQGEPAIAWWPKVASLRQRVQALEDFNRSRVMTRLRIANSDEWSLEPTKADPNAAGGPGTTGSGVGGLGTAGPGGLGAASPAATGLGATGAAATGLGTAGAPPPNPGIGGLGVGANGAPPHPPGEASGSAHRDIVAEAEAEGERLHLEREATEQEREAAELRAAAQKADAERLLRAWPLSRCDQRLTRRLGLL